MKNTDTPSKPYDAIEDAIDLAKKDPTKSWDDLLRKPSDTGKQIGDKEDSSQRNDKAAAATAFGDCYKLYRAR